MNIDMLTQIFTSGVAFAILLIVAATGESISERAGVLNLSMEGMMLTGAFASVLGSATTESPELGVIAGVSAALVFGAVQALLTVRFRADQIVIGIASNALALGLTTYGARILLDDGKGQGVPGFSGINIPFLTDIPIVGRALFGQSLLGYLCVIIVIVLAVVFSGQTMAGVRVDAVGEDATSAGWTGLSVNKIRAMCVLLASATGGLAGAQLALSEVQSFSENMTAGLGYLVVCIVNNRLVVGYDFGMSAPAAPLALSAGERETLEKLTRSQRVPHQQVLQARVLLMAADGVANIRIAEEVGVRPATVRAWRNRYAEDGLAGLGLIRKGRGRRSSISEEKIAEIVRLTKTTTPPGHTHWSCRTMAKKVGVSPSTVQRIWSDLDLKPHRVDSFKVSNDPRFEEKLIDVVGLYVNPPENAIVLCMDEKSQIQALDRTQPSLPLVEGRAGTMTHDYKRNGTTTLFAALDVLTGSVIGQCLPRHRHNEFIKFLNTIDKQVPAGLEVHLILDNYATHKHPEVKRWMDRHKRFHFHFTPTSSSWLNQVERWFRELTDKNIRRGIFGSVPELIASIEAFLNAHNDDPKPYVWTATAESILAKIARARTTLERVAN